MNISKSLVVPLAASLAVLFSGCSSMYPLSTQDPVVAAVVSGAAIVMHKPLPCAKKSKALREKCEAEQAQLNQAISNARTPKSSSDPLSMRTGTLALPEITGKLPVTKTTNNNKQE